MSPTIGNKKIDHATLLYCQGKINIQELLEIIKGVEK